MPACPTDVTDVTDALAARMLEDAVERLAELVAVECDVLGREDGDPCSWEEDAGWQRGRGGG